MAVNSNSYFSKAAQGNPGIAAEVNLFDTHSTPKFAIGYKVIGADGQTYRYSHFGAAVETNRLVSQDISESGAAVDAITVIAPASSVSTTDGNAGTKFLEGTIAAIAADNYAGGTLNVCAGTGRGYTYEIKGNTATGDPASGNLRIELYNKIQASLTSVSDVIIIGSKYANLEHSTGSTDVIPVGVTLRAHAADAWGWIQTHGIVGVFQDGNIPLGSVVVCSNVDAGGVAQMGEYVTSVDLLDLAQLPIVGYSTAVITDAANGTYVPIFLQLEV